MRKIIHIDMDCFYAAIEIRDNPALAGKPVAVGGTIKQRGVICACNYIARKYGVHSAMATAIAYRHCKDLTLLPVNMTKYRQVSKSIHRIFHEYTDLVEPLALDEAYLDVTACKQHHGSATLIAKAIRQYIWKTEALTASAGVAPNKLLAKIASDWKKPNGLFVIHPKQVNAFVSALPVEKIHGVGKVTARKLHNRGVKTCADLQKLSFVDLTQQFGKLGKRLYNQCRGIDERHVEPNRIRKSLSVERTFPEYLLNLEAGINAINNLYQKLMTRIQASVPDYPIKNQYIKIKFTDFCIKTAEIASHEADLKNYIDLFRKNYSKEKRAIRLLGVGVNFSDRQSIENVQQSLFAGLSFF